MSQSSGVALIQAGRSLIANLFGGTYEVFRPSASLVMPGILSSFPSITNYRLKPDHTTMKTLIETNTYELVAFEGKCDGTVLQLGDIIVGTDGTFCLAQARPMEANLLMRVERVAAIALPFEAASSQLASEAEAAPTVLVTAYGSESSASDLPIMIASGKYVVGALGATPAQIPVGLQPLRNHDANNMDSTTADAFAAPDSLALMYIPPLGVAIAINSVVTIASGDQFRVINTNEMLAGFVGTVAIASRVQTYR